MERVIHRLFDIFSINSLFQITYAHARIWLRGHTWYTRYTQQGREQEGTCASSTSEWAAQKQMIRRFQPR